MQQDSRLATMLARINSDALRNFAVPGGQPPDQIVASTRRQSIASADRQPSADFHARLVQAAIALRDGREPDTHRTLRLQCMGCCTYFTAANYAPLADADAMARLLASVESYGQEPSRLRRLLDALLRAFLGARRQEEWFRLSQAQQGSERLRTFIASQFRAIADLEPMPDWVAALGKFPEVLSGEPGSRFARDWLATGGTEFQELSRRLALTGDCWLASETILSATGMATRQNDAGFLAHVQPLLDAAADARFRPLRDSIYAALINRYSELATRPIHVPLRDALVRAWGNPWLASNEASWKLANPAARQLLTSWLKLELIHQFFAVLSDKAWQDTGRFEFWRPYHERMDQVFFALSRAAFRSRDPDMERFRQSASGLIFELTGGTSQNHAFIMCMGDTAVIEFSEKGNAAFRCSSKALNLDTRRTSLAIHELKKDNAQRLLHHNARGLTWQERFASALERPLPQPTLPQPSNEASPKLLRHPSLEQIAGYARTQHLDVEDHRSKGGSFWLRVDDQDPDIKRQLSGWGFNYRPGRGWWRVA